MIFVVDIVGPRGDKATKEYGAASMNAAVRLAQFELRDYPRCQITSVRLKLDQTINVELDDWYGVRNPIHQGLRWCDPITHRNE